MQNLNLNQVSNQDIINFTPNTTNEVAIISIPVLQRLAQALSSTSLRSIKRDFREIISNDETNTMQEYLQLLQNEIDFHTTVTALMEYQLAEPAQEEITL
jgi:phage-related protein